MLLDESEAEILKIINEIGKLESNKKKDYKFGYNRVSWFHWLYIIITSPKDTNLFYLSCFKKLFYKETTRTSENRIGLGEEKRREEESSSKNSLKASLRGT